MYNYVQIRAHIDTFSKETHEYPFIEQLHPVHNQLIKPIYLFL